MDQATLVDEQIVDGRRLLDALEHDKVDVKAAFWLFTTETDQWFFYLVTEAESPAPSRYQPA